MLVLSTLSFVKVTVDSSTQPASRAPTLRTPNLPSATISARHIAHRPSSRAGGTQPSSERRPNLTVERGLFLGLLHLRRARFAEFSSLLQLRASQAMTTATKSAAHAIATFHGCCPCATHIFEAGSGCFRLAMASTSLSHASPQTWSGQRPRTAKQRRLL